MNKIFESIETLVRVSIVITFLILIIGLPIIALPDFLKINWNQDLKAFLIIVVIISIPFILVYFKDKNASIKNIVPNIKKSIFYSSKNKKVKFPILKLFLGISILIYIVQIIIALLITNRR